jgi:hypothetical protein
MGREVNATPDARDVLEFEASRGHLPIETRSHEIRERFGVSPLAFYSALNRLLDSDAVAAAHPRIAAALRDRRDQRSARRNTQPPIERVVPDPQPEKVVPASEPEKVVPEPEVERR